MKNIIIAAVLLFAASNAIAQEGNVAQMHNGYEYKTITLQNANLCEIFSSKPTEIRLVDGQEGYVEISYPVVEQEYLKFGFIHNNTLMIGGNGDNEAPKHSVLSEQTPIYVKVSSSKLHSIGNTSDMVIYIERDMFARNLQIANSLTLGVVAESITSNAKIEITNMGTMTCNVQTWNTNHLALINAGFLYLHGATSAKNIDHQNTGIDNVDLMVSCHKLSLTSMGEGVIQYRGTADDIDITAMGKASIRTSELNRE